MLYNAVRAINALKMLSKRVLYTMHPMESDVCFFSVPLT